MNSKNRETTKLLVEAGASLDTITNNGETVFDLMESWHGNSECLFIPTLLETMNSANITTNKGNSALHLSFQVPCHINRKELITKDSINLINDEGKTPLHLALRYNYLRDAKMMIENGGQSPLDLALSNDSTHLIAIPMVMAEANTNNSNLKIITGHNQIKFILERSNSPNKAIKAIKNLETQEHFSESLPILERIENCLVNNSEAIFALDLLCGDHGSYYDSLEPLLL